MSGTECDGIFFTESAAPPGAVSKGSVTVEISRQNSDLSQVKKKMAIRAKQLGGNAIVSFEYGQKAHSILDQIFTFKWDTESWHGSGIAAVLSED